MLESKIREFHLCFKLPMPSKPVPPSSSRLTRFREMLLDEISECDNILTHIEHGNDAEATIELADWLGDIMVYCASEMMRHGIPIESVLDIIFKSNLSKLGEDGQPIISNGKVQKGPNYWKPEPLIAELLGVK